MEPEQALASLRLLGLPAIDASLLVGFVLPLLRQLQLAGRRSQSAARLPLLALNGPVGAGKSSLGRVLEVLAPAFDLRLVVASIDDLYLPWPERQRRLLGNPFAVSRVPPGSHDLPLLLEALARWRQSGVLRLPRFDKTLAEGQGDRHGWREGPCEALVLEGWLMGCQALGPQGLAAALTVRDLSVPGPAGAPALTAAERDWLPHWDRQLQDYEALWQACDGLWLLRPQSWTLPRRWRFQAEARQRRHGGGWLPPVDLDRLVRASLCSLPPLLYQDPLAADPQLIANPDAASGVLEIQSLAARPWAARPSENRELSSNLPMVKGTGAPGSQQSQSQQNKPPVGSPMAACLGSALPVQGLAVLDGRRRCLTIRRRRPQDSPSASSSLIG